MLPKINTKVKTVKTGKKPINIQKSLDRYRVPVQGISVVNQLNQEVDLEALIVNDSAEWVDVDVEDVDRHDHLGPTASASTKSWAQIALPQMHQVVNTSQTSVDEFSEVPVQHKAQVVPVFLAYHRVQSN